MDVCLSVDLGLKLQQVFMAGGLSILSQLLSLGLRWSDTARLQCRGGGSTVGALFTAKTDLQGCAEANMRRRRRLMKQISGSVFLEEKNGD